jgi:hypothetical protein
MRARWHPLWPAHAARRQPEEPLRLDEWMLAGV